MLIIDAFEIGIVVQHVVEDVEEEAEGELIEVIDEIELLEYEEYSAACLS